jgi:PemK-like, MazF-like toxin of type II toxin-antitoxin system
LWSREAEAGRNQGKDRPACLVVSSDSTAPSQFVVILPITHTPPASGAEGVEIPAKVKKVLGLDDQPSWVIVSEYNIDEWPNGGLSQIPGKPGQYGYGFIPPGLFAQIKEKFLGLARARKSRLVRR